MDLAGPKLVAGLAAVLILTLAHLQLWRLFRRRYLAVWAAALTIYLLRYPLLWWLPGPGAVNAVKVVNATMAVVGAFLLLWGVCLFLGRRFPRWQVWLMAGAYTWVFLARLLGIGPLWATFPCSLALAGLYLHMGLLIWRTPWLDAGTRLPAATGLAAWAAIQSSYPFQFLYPWLLPFGHLFVASLEAWVGISLLILFFHRQRAELLSAHQDLEANQRRLAQLVQVAPMLLYALDEEGRLAAWNHQAEVTTGYTLDYLKTHPQRLTRLIPEASPGEPPHRWRELELTARDGAVKTIAWYVASQESPLPGWTHWGVGLDVTSRRRAQESLKQLAAGVAHNFNNTLQAISGNLEAAAKDLPLDQSGLEAGRLLDNAAQSVHQGRDLVERLTAYVGDQPWDSSPVEPLDLSEMARAAADLARTGWEGLSSGPVAFDLDLDRPVPVRGRRGEILEVILNLIKNALEAMPQGGSLTLFARSQGDRALLYLTDTGQGMDAETLERAFEPFFTTKGLGGQGLGLTTSRGMLRSAQGGLELESSPGRGTKATLWLPLDSGPLAAGLAPPQPRPPLDTSFLKDMRVLIVEDEALVAMGLRALLEGGGAQVRQAGNLAEARAIFNRHHIDLVLCDLGLPDGSGWELVEENAARPDPAPRFILLTGWGPQAIPTTHHLPPDRQPEVMPKPVERRDLLAACRRRTAAGVPPGV